MLCSSFFLQRQLHMSHTGSDLPAWGGEKVKKFLDHLKTLTSWARWLNAVITGEEVVFYLFRQETKRPNRFYYFLNYKLFHLYHTPFTLFSHITFERELTITDPFQIKGKNLCKESKRSIVSSSFRNTLRKSKQIRTGTDLSNPILARIRDWSISN